MDPSTPAPISPTDSARESFGFSGRGSEYFGIWIVNVLLSILTLGIYSAWAKVRRLQYFHRNTHVAGASFDYHGEPLAILKGRAIALVLLVIYSFAGSLGWIGLLVLAALAGAVPWLLLRSLRFRLYNTSLRGLRFGFHGSLREAYSVFLKWPILTGLSFYLLGPMFHQRLKRFQHNQSRFGSARFSFDAPVSRFYEIYVVVIVIGLVAFGLVVLLAPGFLAVAGSVPADSPQRAAAMLAALVVGTLVILPAGMLIRAWLGARVPNLVWGATQLEGHRFECRLRTWPLFLILFTNLIGIVLTLGLYKPFADVRLAKYRVESMTLLPAGDLEAFFADQAKGVAATGEEFAEMFDIDIAL